MPPTISSPRCSAPTPAGVPVKIQVAGSERIYVDSSAMISDTFQIISDRSACWRVSPLTRNQIAPRLK